MFLFDCIVCLHERASMDLCMADLEKIANRTNDKSNDFIYFPNLESQEEGNS